MKYWHLKANAYIDAAFGKSLKIVQFNSEPFIHCSKQSQG